jgi:hypothetical protein
MNVFTPLIGRVLSRAKLETDSPPVPPHKERKSMSRESAPQGGKSAAEWPTSPDIAGYTWELGPGPTEADAQWAAQNLNDDDFHTEDPTPDEVLDRLAEEAEAQDRIENGTLL